MAKPLGFEPTVTSVVAGVLVSRFRMDTVPGLLLLTTANPNREITATAAGVAPVGMRCIKVPKVESGFRLIMEASEHPKSATTAMSRCSSIATAPGAEAVPEHAGIGTASITEKSVLLETTPVLLTTSSAKRRGAVRNDDGMAASISRALTKVAGTDLRSRRTPQPASKPEPKTRTPLRVPGVMPLVVIAAWGKSAPGMGGVMTCSMFTGLKDVLSLK